MSNPRSGQTIQTVQVIVAALLMGMVTITGIMFVMGSGNEPDPSLEFLAYAAVAFGLIGVLARLIVPGIIGKATGSEVGGNPDDEESSRCRWLGGYTTAMVISNAIPEGAGFFTAIALFLTGATWLLAISGGLILLMLMLFPSESRFQSWMRTHSENADF